MKKIDEFSILNRMTRDEKSLIKGGLEEELSSAIKDLCLLAGCGCNSHTACDRCTA